MRKISAAASLLLCCLLGFPCGSDAGTAERDAARNVYKEGLRAYRAGNLDAALERFRLSIEIDPDYPYPSFAQARIYHAIFDQETRHYKDAVEAYEKTKTTLKAFPPPAEQKGLYQAYFFSGLLYLRGGDYEKALPDLRDFQQLDPDFPNKEETFNAIGIALYYLDQYDKAVEEFKRALDIDPDYAEARFNLRSVFTRLAAYNEAVAISRAGELNLAMEKVQQLKEFAPRYLPARRLEAKLYEALGEEGKALDIYSEILGVDADHPITYQIRLQMAKIFQRRGEKDSALALLEQNLHKFPQVDDERSRREVMELVHSLRGAP